MTQADSPAPAYETPAYETPAFKTAAVILNHNDNGNALRLAAAFRQYSSVNMTVIVDNSGDNGIEFADCEKTVLLKIPNNGYSAGNNAGLHLIDEKGGAEFVIISNPDVYIENDDIESCVSFLRQNPNFALASPRMRAADGTPHHLAAWRERTFLCDFAYSSGLLSRIVGMGRECYPEDYLNQPVAEVDCVAGSFFVIKRDTLAKAGDFDEHTFLYYEEDILGYKLKRLCCKSALLGGFMYIHCEGASVNKSMNYLKKYWAMQKSRLYFHRHYKHTALPKYAALCLATALGTVEKALKTLFHRFN